MKIVKVKNMDGTAKFYVNDLQIKPYDVTYKLKGNKHHLMTVFGKDELEAYTTAFSKINNLKEET